MRLFACLIVAPQRGYDEPAILSYAIISFCPTSADGLQLGLCSFSCTATSRHGSGRAALSTRVAVRSAICGPSTTSWPSTRSSKRAASGPSRLVATAAEDRLNFRRAQFATRLFAAASDCRAIAIYEYASRVAACANVSRTDVPIDPMLNIRLRWCPTRVRSPPSLLWSDSATVKTPHSKFGAQPLVLRIHQLSVDGR